MNAAAFLLFFAVGGISGLIAFGFFSLDLLGKISAKIEWMRNISLFSLYRPAEIINGNVNVTATFL